MRATAYFQNSQEMADAAKAWAKERSDRWFVRTNFRCDHIHHEKRKSILLIEGEQVIQKLTTCKTCHKHAGNNVKLKNSEENGK